MAEVKYVEMKLKSDRLGRRASLRDYTMDLRTGKSVVNEDKKVSKPIGKNDTVRVIYPAELSEDGKWVRAMNADGQCGYIRASRVDLGAANFNAGKAQGLKAPYVSFISDHHRIAYEAKNGSTEYPKDKVNNAQKEVAAYRQNAALGKQILDGYNDYVEFYNKFHPDDPKPTADPVNGRPLENEILDYAKAQNISGAYNAYSVYRSQLDFIKDQQTLKEANLACEIDFETGRVQTSLGPLEAKAITANLYRVDTNPYKPNTDRPSGYNACRDAQEDLDNFHYGNRFLAEKLSLERLQFKEKADAAVTQDGFDMPLNLKDPFHEFERDVQKPDMIANQVKENGGLLICENHGSPVAKDWITQNMAAMKESGVGVVYIEHMLEGNQQNLIDSFLKSEKGSPMSPALKNFCNNDASRKPFADLLEAARENDMRVVGIGSSLAQTNTSENPHERISTFNERAHEIITNDQFNHVEDPNKGYVLLAGQAHVIFHEGLDKTKPLKGLSHMLGARAIEINKTDDGLVPSVVASDQVFVPGKDSLVKVSEYEKSLNAEKAPENKAPENKAPEEKPHGRQEIPLEKLAEPDKPERKAWVRAEIPKGPRPEKQPLSQRGPHR